MTPQTFILLRIARSFQQPTPPQEIYAAYVEAASADPEGPAPCTPQQFAAAMLAAGMTYAERGGFFRWHARVRAEGEDPFVLESQEERTETIRAQLDVLRNETFGAVCALRAAGQHRHAAQNIRAYCDILREIREQFPAMGDGAEGADLHLPEAEPFPDHAAVN
jgi:hypothetical protein